jgi:hypothetical protein
MLQEQSQREPLLITGPDLVDHAKAIALVPIRKMDRVTEIRAGCLPGRPGLHSVLAIVSVVLQQIEFRASRAPEIPLQLTREGHHLAGIGAPTPRQDDLLVWHMNPQNQYSRLDMVSPTATYAGDTFWADLPALRQNTVHANVPACLCDSQTR